MKRIHMKGKSVDNAVEMALQVLGGSRENAKVNVIREGKPGVLGVIGGEEAEVEVVLKEGMGEDAKQILQDILDRMEFVAMVEVVQREEGIGLDIKGEDMGRIIGKEGATLKALEIVVSTILGQLTGERLRVEIDADGYKDKRKKALERLAKDAADEVASSGKERVLPPMNPADRRIIHIFLKDNAKITTFSKGFGRERRLVIAPRD
jgi:spoIIIJ-associated protein